MRPEIIEFTKGIPVSAFVRGVYHYPYHWHDTLEIIQVLEGSACIGVGDDNLILQKNDIVIININELHRIIRNPQETADNKILFIQVDSTFYRSLLHENSYVFLYCCSAYHEAMVPQKYEKLREYIASLTSGLMENPLYGQNHDEKIKNVLADMLDYLTYQFDFLRWGYGTTPFSEKFVGRLKQIASHTMSDLEIQLRLKELANEVGVSLKHLSSDIKDKFGLTFQELLSYGKCAHGAKLLLSTNRRIIEIALDCGFSDVKYFVKYFRQYFHCNPSEFRKKYRVDKQALEGQAEYCNYPLSDGLIQK